MGLGIINKTVWVYRTSAFPNFQPVTAMGWTRIDTLTETSNLVSLTEQGSDDFWGLFVTATGQIQTYFSTGTVTSAAGLIRTRTWYNLAFTYGDNLTADLCRIYLNGIRVASGTTTAPSGTPNRFSIGRSQQAFSILGGKQFIRVWNRELTASEILAESRRTVPTRFVHTAGITGLYADYQKCGGALEDYVRDFSGAGHPLDTITDPSALTFYSDPPDPSLSWRRPVLKFPVVSSAGLVMPRMAAIGARRFGRG